MLTPSPTRASTQLRSSKSKKTRRRGNTTRRVMDVEMVTLTPLVFGTNGGMGLDCQNFLRTLANKLSTKNDEPYASVISWLRIQLSFAILRSVHRCVRGSRYPFKSREVSEDFTLAHCQKLGTRWRLRVRTKAIMAANSYKKMYGDKETCSNISIMSLRVFGARLETC